MFVAIVVAFFVPEVELAPSLPKWSWMVEKLYVRHGCDKFVVGVGAIDVIYCCRHGRHGCDILLWAWTPWI